MGLIDTFNRVLNLGFRLYRPFSHIGTVGFRAMRPDGTVGFVTAAHILTTHQQFIYNYWSPFETHVGRLVNRSQDFRLNTILDAVFFTAHNNITLTNWLPNFLSLSPTVAAGFLPNQPIMAAGSRTGGTQIGHVIATGQERRMTLYDGRVVTIHNLVQTNLPNQQGDSGGTVFTMALFTAGIIVMGNNNAMYFTPADIILRQLNVSRY